MMNRTILGCAALAAGLAAGCTTLVVGGGPSGSSSSTSGDVTTTTGGTGGAPSNSATTGSSATTSTTSTGAGTGGAMTGGWQVGASVQIGVASGAQLDSAIAYGGGALLGLRRYDSTGTVVYWDVQLLDGNGAPLTPAQNLAQGATNQSVGNILVAAAAGHVGAVVSDSEAGCGFVPLHDDGSPAGARVATGSWWCQGLAADAAGYSFFGGGLGIDPPNLVHLDAAGGAAGSTVMSNVLAYQARVDAADGSFLLASSTDGVECWDCALHVVSQRYSAGGLALGPVHPVFQDASYGYESDHARLEIIPVAGGNLVAWSPEANSSAKSGAVTAFRIDDLGGPAGSQVVADNPTGKAIGGLGLASVPGGDVLLAWTAPGDSYDATLRARMLSPDGALKGPVFDVQHFAAGSVVRLLPTSTGVLALVQTGSFVTALPLTAP